MIEKKYKFRNSLLTICFGDIVNSTAEVIVSSCDDHISMSCGVSAHVLAKGGMAIAADARKHSPAEVGDVVATTAGDMPQKYIFHAVTRKYHSKPHNTPKVTHKTVERIVTRCFQLAEALHVSSLAMPAIGTGFARMPLAEVAAGMADEISDRMLQTPRHYEVTIWLYDNRHKLKEMDYIDFFTEFARCTAKPLPAPLDDSGYDTDFPDKAFGTDVFVSYAREDCYDSKGREKPGNYVSKLRKLLSDNGISYWMDVNGIYSGDKFGATITAAILSCRALVFVASRRSKASLWCTKEVALAVKHHKAIIPIRIDDSEYNFQVQYFLSDIEWFAAGDDENALIASIKSKTGKE